MYALLSLSGQNREMVRVYTEETGEGQYEFFADNDYIIPVWISIQFTSLVNLKASVALPFQALLPARTKGTPLFTLEKSAAQGRRSYSMSLIYAKGDPAAVRPDENFLYLFPFEHGSKHRVTQGYNGSFTHKGDNLYALDFDLDTGSPVFAARGGLVVEVKKDSNRGGPAAMYNKDANFISILHGDGTIGNYVHLRQNGALVAAGDEVTAGQFIGYSGNTGVSSGPHLHFDVQAPTAEGKMRPLPVKFLNYDGKPVEEAKEGEYYYALHPGKPSFPVIFGSLLTEDDFRGYSQPALRSAKVELRFEKIDETYVVFVNNGTDSAQEVTVDFRLRNLVPSRPEPLTVTVPARTEHFLLLLRARPRASSWEYGYTIRTQDAR
jgi:murein DD-endopeptidase MepM/ murein hydrolase activator NlpD